MERIIVKSKCGMIAINDIIIYPKTSDLKYAKASELQFLDWKRIYPKYYKWLEDDSIIEIWFDTTGMMIEKGLGTIEEGTISTRWSRYSERIIDITDEYTSKKSDLIDKVTMELEKENLIEPADYKPIQNNNGGATDYYSLPKNANTLQDLIEHRNMNGSVKDIFKACYRLGIKTEDELRDLNKMAYYSLREIGRITNRRDYITIAKELMGEQATENKQKGASI